MADKETCKQHFCEMCGVTPPIYKSRMEFVIDTIISIGFVAAIIVAICIVIYMVVT